MSPFPGQIAILAKTLEQMKENSNRIVNYKLLRQGTGIVAFLLPIFTYLLSGKGPKLNSISGSYWTDSGDLFVGSLVAVAFFLAAYNGTGACSRDTEYKLSKFAGFFAVIVAFFPTSDGQGCGDTVPAWVQFVSNGHTNLFHNYAAVLLFACLFFLITFFARRAFYKGKVARFRVYTAISWGMVIGMPLAYYIVNQMGRTDGIFWVELVGLWLFGAGWLIAGSYKADAPQYQMADYKLIGEWQVDAAQKDFASDLAIEPGVRYLFKASGCWKDWFISCGPTGWGPGWKWFTSKNRIKGQPFFMLCGNINQQCDDPLMAFPIGHEKEWTAPKELSMLPEGERQLYFFANDWETKYGNNSGATCVRAYKLK